LAVDTELRSQCTGFQLCRPELPLEAYHGVAHLLEVRRKVFRLHAGRCQFRYGLGDLFGEGFALDTHGTQFLAHNRVLLGR
jgi:hypothetical protein